MNKNFKSKSDRNVITLFTLFTILSLIQFLSLNIKDKVRLPKLCYKDIYSINRIRILQAIQFISDYWDGEVLLLYYPWYRVPKCMKMHAKVYPKPPLGHIAVYGSPCYRFYVYRNDNYSDPVPTRDPTRNSLNGNGTRIAPRGIRNCARNNGRPVSPILGLLPFLVRIFRRVSNFLSLSLSLSLIHSLSIEIYS